MEPPIWGGEGPAVEPGYLDRTTEASRMGLFQPMHLLVIFAIALLIFGPKKLPELGKGLGEAIRGFKESLRAGEATPRRLHRGPPRRPEPGRPNPAAKEL